MNHYFNITLRIDVDFILTCPGRQRPGRAETQHRTCPLPLPQLPAVLLSVSACLWGGQVWTALCTVTPVHVRSVISDQWSISGCPVLPTLVHQVKHNTGPKAGDMSTKN